MLKYVLLLSKNTAMSMAECLKQPLSFAKLYYQSSAYQLHQDLEKQQQEITLAKFKQGNVMIECMNALIKKR